MGIITIDNKCKGGDYMKKIDFSKSIFELSQEYPEIIEIMVNMGFKDIAKKGMINTAGRIMTIPKGAIMKGLEIETIKKEFENKGFIIN